MKINWNWGTGILIGIILFMSFIIGLVYVSTKQNFDLVEKDYYPKALEYQQQIDKKQNAQNLDEQIQVENTGDHIVFTFQSFFDPGDISGTITFYRPSDKKGDLQYKIQPDSSGQQSFGTDHLQTGKYIVKIDYEVSGTPYYQEKTIFVNLY